jgi:peptidoglycan/xylan/chitin deacetylase (PgdA/CDA1 family)
MRLRRIQRRLNSECHRIASSLLSRGIALVRDFRHLPLALFAHGLYDETTAGPGQFPIKNFMSVRELRDEVEWLGRHGYRFIGFGELLGYLRRENDLPAKAVHLMFDDGYRSVYEHAFPMLRGLGMPFSVALVESFVRQGRLLWFDDLHCRIQAWPRRLPDINRIAPDVLWVESLDSAAFQVTYGINRLKLVSDSRRREILDAISKLCPLEETFVSGHLRPLGTEQIHEMRTERIAFVAHTRTHPILSNVEDADSIRSEAANWDPQILEAGCLVLPEGKPMELSARVANPLREAGIAFAFSTVSGFVDREARCLGLNRVSMQGGLKNLRARLATIEVDHLQSLKAHPDGAELR